MGLCGIAILHLQRLRMKCNIVCNCASTWAKHKWVYLYNLYWHSYRHYVRFLYNKCVLTRIEPKLHWNKTAKNNDENNWKYIFHINDYLNYEAEIHRGMHKNCPKLYLECERRTEKQYSAIILMIHHMIK